MISFPDHPHCITQSDRVAAIARQLGIFSRLITASSLAHVATGLFYRRHPTHWLLFGLVTGMQITAENGLILGILPKSQFTEAQAHSLFASMIDSSQTKSS